MRRITIRLDEGEYLALRRLADLECRTMSRQIVRMILAEAARKGVYTPVASKPTLVRTTN